MTLSSITQTDPRWHDFQSALIEAGLLVDDLNEPDQHFFVADSGAMGGFAIAGKIAMFRSIVVPLAARKHGAGRGVVEALAHKAASMGAANAWLLTTNAGDFFSKCGFEFARRDAAPSFVRATRQFSGLCPTSAFVMHRRLID